MGSSESQTPTESQEVLQYSQDMRHTEDVAAESAGQLELLARARLRGLREARGWSLDRLAALDADVTLTGHGEPWRRGLEAAVAEARDRGPT